MSANKRVLQIVLAGMLASSGSLLLAQKLPTGPQVLTLFSSIDNSDQLYSLYLPKNFDEHKTYPLIIMLHGAWANHRSGLNDVFGASTAPSGGPARHGFPEWKDQDYIVAAPYARNTMGYQGIVEKEVWELLADLKRRFNIDEDRTYLTGLSMGGGGTLWLGLSRPDVWAAIAPVCPAPPYGTIPLAPNALNVPIHIFQGDADPLVAPDATRAWVKRLQDAGARVEYKEYPGVGHNVWENAYKDEFIFQWFSQFKRNRVPDRVHFATQSYDHASAYWVTFDKLTTGTLASIDAQFTGPNQVAITTSGLDAFTLNLAGHPKFSASSPVTFTLDSKSLSGRGDTVSFAKKDGAWSLSKDNPSGVYKKAGLEGPMTAIFGDRHVYVYGTAGNPTPEDTAARRAVASRAAAWDGGVGDAVISFRIIGDNQNRFPGGAAPMVLFGNKDTNNLIAKFDPQLPIHLNPSAGDYGLVYIYPVDGRYVLVNSGVPWFPQTSPEPGGRGGRRGAAPPAPQAAAARGPRPAPRVTEGSEFLPPVPALLSRHGDFVLFQGTMLHILVEGRFDNEWHLSAADTEKLKATGIITITQ